MNVETFKSTHSVGQKIVIENDNREWVEIKAIKNNGIRIVDNNGIEDAIKIEDHNFSLYTE